MLLERVLDGRERRWTLRNPPEEILELLTGGRTASGERVGARSALGLSAYFAAIRAISEDVAKLPLPVYRRKGKNGRERERLRSHPVDRMLNIAPNEDTNAMSFRESLMQHAMGWGDGFAKIRKDGNGKPIALEMIDPDRVEPYRVPGTKRLMYEIRADGTNPTSTLPPRRIFHLHGFGFNGLTGYSIASLARETIGEGMASTKAGASFFGNNSRPGGVIETTVPIKHKETRERWEKEFGSPENFNRTAVLGHGLTYKAISVPNKDAQWIESRQFTVEEMARWFRIQPHKLMHLLRATFSNIIEQNIDYVTDTLQAWFVRFEQEVQRKLLLPSESDLYVEHNASALLRGDPKARNESYAIGRQWGWLSANDVREKENENPLPGDQGEIYLVPSTHVNAEQVANPPEPESPALPAAFESEGKNEPEAADTSGTPRRTIEGIVYAHIGLFADAYGSVLRIESDKLARAAKKGRVPWWIDEFYPAHTKHVADRLWPCVDTCVRSARSVLMETGGAGDSEAIARAYTQGMAYRYVAASQADIAGKPVETVIAEWGNGRAAKEVELEREGLIELILRCVGDDSEVYNADSDAEGR